VPGPSVGDAGVSPFDHSDSSGESVIPFKYRRSLMVLVAKWSLDESAQTDVLSDMIAKGSKRMTASVLKRVTDDPAAVKLICSIASGLGVMPSVKGPLRRAAIDGNSASVDILVGYRNCDSDVDGALDSLVEKDDGDAVKCILDACARSMSVKHDQYTSWVRDALLKAAEDDKASIAEAVTDMCNDKEDLEYILVSCGGHLGNLDIFKRVWKHARLCAREFVERLYSGPARDYLYAKIDADYRCHGDCDECASSDDDDDDDSNGADDIAPADNAPSDCQ